MARFTVDPLHEAEINSSGEVFFGEIFRVARNPSSQGSTSTPIARFYGTKPVFVENFHTHWRVDCYVSKHPLSPKPEALGKTLVAALKHEQFCAEPIWVSWHSSEEQGGEAFGQVFDFD